MHRNCSACNNRYHDQHQYNPDQKAERQNCHKPERCKGCGFCVITCPKKLIEIETANFNAAGYFPARFWKATAPAARSAPLSARILRLRCGRKSDLQFFGFGFLRSISISVISGSICGISFFCDLPDNPEVDAEVEMVILSRIRAMSAHGISL